MFYSHLQKRDSGERPSIYLGSSERSKSRKRKAEVDRARSVQDCNKEAFMNYFKVCVYPYYSDVL